MVCEHLTEIEQELIAAGVEETYRGQPWTSRCREWVYFNCWLDRQSLRGRLNMADCVHDHLHRGTHDGQEAGFVCTQCDDGIMGMHDDFKNGYRVFG